MSSQYGFYFESVSRGAMQGPIDPAEQYFRGSEIESLVRELGQNSLDAREGTDPVRMLFELRTMATEDVPGIDDIRMHAEWAVQFSEHMAGHERVKQALEAANSEAIPVLRVADYGTKGLHGTESMHDTKSPLVSLTRGAGVSDTDVKRGGSFGIGSAVGRLVSGLRTVLYRSLPSGKAEDVFAAKCRLATHYDSEQQVRAADGFYTRGDRLDDFEYLPNPSPLKPFADRTEPGTDTFILDYTHAENDPRLSQIRDAVIENFLVAIYRGSLVVEGKLDDEVVWSLTPESLASYVKDMPHVAPFYRALGDPEPYEGDIPGVGFLKLFVEVDDSLDRKLHTVAIRGPLMKITTYRHNSISLKYAAILDASDEDANAVLRALEPPEHHDWQPGRAPGGHQVVRSVKQFILEGLRSKVVATSGEEIKIEGLAKLLPAGLLPQEGADAAQGVPAIGEPSEKEAAGLVGREDSPKPVEPRFGRVVRVSLREPATASESGKPIEKGKDRGGSGSRNGDGPGLPGEGDHGAGGSKIRRSEVEVRCWQSGSRQEWTVAVTPLADVFGDLTLAALDIDGAPIDDLDLGIEDANRLDGEARIRTDVSGNTLKGLALDEGETARFKIKLSSNRRYRIGVV